MSVRAQQLFLTQLRSLRNTMASAVDQIDVLLDMAEQSTQPQQSPGECPHPMGARRPTPAMGHPTRFRCTACNQEVEG